MSDVSGQSAVLDDRVSPGSGAGNLLPHALPPESPALGQHSLVSLQKKKKSGVGPWATSGNFLNCVLKESCRKFDINTGLFRIGPSFVTSMEVVPYPIPPENIKFPATFLQDTFQEIPLFVQWEIVAC